MKIQSDTPKKGLAKSRRSPRYSDLYLEQALLGELSPKELKRLQADPETAVRLLALQEETEKTLLQYPPETMLETIKNRAQKQESQILKATFTSNPKTLKFGLRGFALAACSLLVLGAGLSYVMVSQNEEPTRYLAFDTNRVKGSVNQNNQEITGLKSLPGLEIFRRIGTKVEELSPGSVVHANENLQIAYKAAGRPFGMIVSLDGNKRLTLHFPESLSGSVLLQQEESSILPYAYKLDDAPSFEHFYFVTTKNDFRAQDVWDELNKSLKSNNWDWQNAQLPPLSKSFEIQAFSLIK